jgi:hypothetical protein
MPSPFPGMDPFIEDQKWTGFHNRFINELGDTLVALLRPRYEVEPEERIYVETTEGDTHSFRADVAVAEGLPHARRNVTSSAVLDIEPRVYALPMPATSEEREGYLVIRKAGERAVVTVIELLSPTNKRPGSDGRREYLKKRNEVLRSSSHLVEIDLLLQGERMPTLRPLVPTTDYCAFVCRADNRPQADVFEWTLGQRLPRIPIPLLPGDADAIIDLQAALTGVYDRAGYDYSIHYDEPLRLSFRPTDETWMRKVIAMRTAG